MDLFKLIYDYVVSNPLQVLGTIIGIVYLVQEIMASKWMWLSSVIMPVISLFVYWKAGLYADFGIDIYYVIIAVYGFCAWQWGGRKKDETKGELPVTRTPLKAWPLIAAASLAIFFVIRWILMTYTDSTVPNADSFTTALSIVAMVMLSRKWIEQWLVWAVVDAACVALYIYKGVHGYALLYAIYTVMAFYGYARWLKKIEK